MEEEMVTIKAEHGEEWHDEVYSMYKERRGWFNYTDPISNLIVNGLIFAIQNLVVKLTF